MNTACVRRSCRQGIMASAVGAGLLMLLQGCMQAGTNAEVTSGQNDTSIAEKQAVAYNGPKARIAVSRFDDKTGKGWYTHEIGNGMADMLTTALVNSNRYIVLERQQLGAVMKEQDLGASGRIRQDTAAPVGQIEGAELLVTGAVTGFEGNASGAQASGGGITSGLLGGITGGFKKAYMAIDMRVIDTRTSRIVAATTVEGEATDVNVGGLMAGFGSAGALGGSLSVWKNTPTEKALRICIKKAVEFVVNKTPQNYYHYNAQGQPISQGGSGGGQPGGQAQSSGTAASTGDGSAGGAASETVTVKPDNLNVRSGPGTNYSKMGSVGSGDELEVLERQGKWIRVRAGSTEGWVAGWLVE